MTNFSFPVRLTVDHDDGGYVVTFPDLPEAITQGNSICEGINKTELARQLKLDEKEIRRILNPRHATKISTIERVLSALGKKLEVRMQGTVNYQKSV